MNHHKKIQHLTILAILFLLSVSIPAHGWIVSEDFLSSPDNLNAGITITMIPMFLISESDTAIVAWIGSSGSEHGILWYDLNPGNADTNNYNYRYEDPDHLDTLFITGEELEVGLLYCMISTPSGETSIEFPIVRESEDPVELIEPQSPIGGIGGVTTTTPLFRWVGTNVPYYHIILSDQEFEIEEDSAGVLTTTGANIIWQVITSGTEIIYGTPDPSGTFTNYNFPPLVGNSPGEPRPTYNWVALNNYANDPVASSDVVGDLMAFEINVTPPFDPPVLLEPLSPPEPEPLSILTSDVIDMVWTYILQASNYHLYLTKKEETPGASSAYIPIWYIQTTNNAVECPAASILTDGEYRWKIIAEDNQGLGSMSVPADFYYSIEAKNIWLLVRAEGSLEPVTGVRVNYIPIEGPSLLFSMTDDNGYSWKDMPYGTYIFEFSKDGFYLFQSPEFVVDENTLDGDGNIYTSINGEPLIITPMYSTVFGSVTDEIDSLVTFADVTATNSTT